MKPIQITNRQAQELANKLKTNNMPSISTELEMMVKEAVATGVRIIMLDQDVMINAYKIYISGSF